MMVKLVFGPAHGKVVDIRHANPEIVFAMKDKRFKHTSLIDPNRRYIRYRRAGELRGKEVAFFVGDEGG